LKGNWWLEAADTGLPNGQKDLFVHHLMTDLFPTPISTNK